MSREKCVLLLVYRVAAAPAYLTRELEGALFDLYL